MNKMVSAAELALPTMSRKDKLLRFAQVVRSSRVPLYMLNGLEHRSLADLLMLRHPQSAFSAAAQDPILRDAGMSDDSAGGAMQFLEISQDELHAFACNCGGQLSNGQMADRIEYLATLR